MRSEKLHWTKFFYIATDIFLHWDKRLHFDISTRQFWTNLTKKSDWFVHWRRINRISKSFNEIVVVVIIPCYQFLLIENINECKEMNTCHAKTTCTDIDAGYICKCNEMSIGNGRVCLPNGEYCWSRASIILPESIIT